VTQVAVSSDAGQTIVGLRMLEIILGSPLWPHRHLLSESGKVLHDAMVDGAKPFARAVAEERYSDAWRILGGWSALGHAFIDGTLVNDPDEVVATANRRLLGVLLHYVGAMGVPLEGIQVKRPAVAA
jgi:hypothetical protein